jgi:hypothetical protein
MNGTSERPVTLSRQTAQAAQRPPGRTRCDKHRLSQLHDNAWSHLALRQTDVPVFAAQEGAPARTMPAVICFPSCNSSPNSLVTSDQVWKSARFRVG